MNSLWRHLQFSLRLLWKTPGFTTVAAFALALGIGANTAIFSVVYATLLAPLPYRDSDRIVMVWSKVNGQRNGVAAGDFLDWKQQNSVFSAIAAWNGRGMSLSTSSHPEQIQAEPCTPGFLEILGQPLLLGRDFLPVEGEVGKDHETILTYKLWKNRFGADRGILGKSVRLDGEQYTVVGVLAPGATDRVQSQLYIPLAFKPEQINHDFHWLLVLARLKPGVTIAQANANMDAVTKHIAQVYPKSDTGWGATVEPLQNDFLAPDTIRALWILLGAVAFVLLIACANVANLLLARGTARRREVAIRGALGATRAQLFAQFLTESVALAAIGGALGVALAWGFLRLILTLMPPFTLPSEADVRLSLPVLLFTLAATMLSGILFGCAPAFQAMGLNLTDALKDGGHGSIGVGRHRVRYALVVVEFALALTLLAAAGLAIHSVWNLAHADAGFRSDHILTFALPMPYERHPKPQEMLSFYRELLDRVNALPGVSSSSVSTGMPVLGASFGMPFNIVGKEIVDPSQRPDARFYMASPGYFQTFGIHIKRGRTFTEADTAGGMPVALVNVDLVQKYLHDVDPLRQQISVEQLIPGVAKLGPPVAWQIVGVYENVRTPDPKDGQRPEIIVPFAQSPWPGVGMAVRTFGDPASMSKSIAAVVQSMDPDLPMADVKTMDQLVDESMGGDRFGAVLFAAFAAIALLLAAFGIYGVMSFAVAQRTHEIGLRMALGAASDQVLGMILKEGMALGAIGVLIGFAGAWSVGHLMSSLLYGVSVFDYGAFSAVAGVLLLSALLACFVPARRATRVDPLIALRDE
ncbi:MAG TPA: ABC transporter permease [Candidatus Sulfotelmatobacter sp.]|nr:ABC transporter permease [Candidatus Sulfotelmatobacter sp.]